MTTEQPVPRIKGTAEWLPESHARIAGLEALAFDRFERAGYQPIQTPILESVELHERKSGAGIVSKLFELAGTASGRVCLRPEMTAGIVRTYASLPKPPRLPWRVSHSGTVFRHEASNRSDRLREFRQVGIERLGDGGAMVDAEVIWLACWTLAEAGLKDFTVRIGDVGLILEMLARSGLPATAQSALVEMLSESAAEGGDLDSIGRGLDHYTDWLRQASDSEEIVLPNDPGSDLGIDRLFRTLVPVVNGRRPGHEIVRRLRKKWDLGHGWLATIDRVREQVQALTQLKGPPLEVLDRLSRDYEDLAPVSIASLRGLVASMSDHGVDLGRLEIDLGFSRGIGFYSQMVFEVVAATPQGSIEVGGGGRYDGLARVLGSDRDDRGVGFAFGLERLDAALQAQGAVGRTIEPDHFLVVTDRSELTPNAVRVATRLRAAGFKAIIEVEPVDELLSGRVVLVDEAGSNDMVHFCDSKQQTPRRMSLPELIRIVSAGEPKS